MSEPPARSVLAAISSNRVPGRQQPFVLRRAMDDASNEDDATQQSFATSDNSNISNLSLVSGEDLSDGLQRRMLDHARLSQTRWTKNSALDAEPLNMHQPFRRSKPGLGLVSMMREPEIDPDVPFLAGRPPSPNLPRQWGRRGRQRNDFLRNLSGTNVQQPSESSSSSQPIEEDHRYNNEPSSSQRYTTKNSQLMPSHTLEPRSHSTVEHTRNSKKNAIETTRRAARDNDQHGQRILSKTLPKSSEVELDNQHLKPLSTTVPDARPKSKSDEVDNTRKHSSRDLLQQLARAASLSPSPLKSALHPLTSADEAATPLAESISQTSRRGLYSRRLLPSKEVAKPHNKLEEIEGPASNMVEYQPQEPLTDKELMGVKAGAEDPSTIPDLDKDTLDLVRNVQIPLHKGQSLRRGLPGASLGLQHESNQFTQSHEVSTSCSRCNAIRGVTIGHVLADTWSACRTYFYSRPKGGRHLRLTWLGACLLAVCLWLMTEITLCEYYCHPIYAKYMIGYGVDIRRPRMPYVTTTIMIKQPFEWVAALGNKLGERLIVGVFAVTNGEAAFSSNGLRPR